MSIRFTYGVLKFAYRTMSVQYLLSCSVFQSCNPSSPSGDPISSMYPDQRAYIKSSSCYTQTVELPTNESACVVQCPKVVGTVDENGAL